MSSQYVRSLIETWLRLPAMSVPYYSTINEEQNPIDDIWCTAEFSSVLRERITFCDDVTNEEGEIEVIYRSAPGIGADGLIAAIESDISLLMLQRDAAGSLTLLNRSAPFEFTVGSASHAYGLSVIIDYQLYK